jgi:hypothetical protein
MQALRPDTRQMLYIRFLKSLNGTASMGHVLPCRALHCEQGSLCSHGLVLAASYEHTGTSLAGWEESPASI